MASIQISRDDPRLHQPRDVSRDGLSFDTSPLPASKRLFSSRSHPSDQTTPSENYDKNGENTFAEDDYPSGKRYRPMDWPLTNTSPNVATSARARYRGRDSRKSPPRRPTSAQARASRFIEGSMNDRASQKPPADYIGNDEDIRDRYEDERRESRSMGFPRKFTHHPNPSAAHSSATNASHHSSIFRFGKSLAASFNPTNWKIWAKDAKLESICETDQQKTMRQRQEKAERIYKELKMTGYFHDGAHSGNLQRATDDKKAQHDKHDSGVDFGRRSSSLNGRMTIAEKRMGRIFEDGTPLQQVSRGETPGSITSASVAPTSSPRKSFQFKKPSLPNIRKSLDFSSKTSDYGSDDPSMPKIPSRKDLEKQQRLVKRVSDLEGKLEAARRQLSEAIGEPLPSEPVQAHRGRPQFVPGVLSTLPSERFLSGYVSEDGGLSEDGALSEIGKAVTIEPKMDEHRADSGLVPIWKKTTQKAALDSDTPEKTQLRKDISEDLDRNGMLHPSEASQRVVAGYIDGEPRGELPPQTDKSLPQPKPSLIEHIAFQSLAQQPTEADVPRKSIESNASVDINPRPTRLLSKKRKSTAADDGIYRPPPETDDEELEPVKKITPPKKRARRLEKTAKEASPTPGFRKTEPQNQRNADDCFYPLKKPATLPNKLSKIPRKPTSTQQSVLQPPSSEFNGLEYPKPMASPDREKTRNVLQDDVEPYSAVPGTGSDVPPMPKLPKAVRLPSGEVVNTAETGKTKDNEARKVVFTLQQNGGGPKKSEMEKQARSQQSFEWERDTF